MRINTIGVILTDTNGSIVSDDGKPTFMHMPKSVRALDQAIMNRVILDNPYSLIVIGENTFHEIRDKDTKLAQSIKRSQSKVLVSSSYGAELYNRLGATSDRPSKTWTYETDNPKEELQRIAYSIAYQGFNDAFGGPTDHIPEIIILGGHSVYEAFNFHYTEVYHNKFNGDIGGSRSVNMVGEDPRLYQDSLDVDDSMIIEPNTEIMYCDNQFTCIVHRAKF